MRQGATLTPLEGTVELRLIVIALAWLTFALVPAKAGALTQSDLDGARAVFRTLENTLDDVLAAEKGIQQSMHRFSANGYCVELIRDSLMIAQSDILQPMFLVSIDLRITNVSDEQGVREIIKQAVDLVRKELNTVRERVGRLSGGCSEHPLAVAKAQQTLQALERASGFVATIEPRL